ncbi:hypothetical protein E4T56_gene1122 [Termitomyces sp. T112]|nr:hypothetical protein E4T56_gene1122 [Termitomyces sp. T112]KAH0586378.1 hypothetical protein H2248_007619 [Termitomyces sp. 'cryptogamus']
MDTDPESEYTQSVTISFEWTLRGLKNLFESSKGDAKSKTTRSVRFGGGRWQILFYANAGTTKEGSASSSDGGGYISLYLSCEPTQEERDAAGDEGKWIREGIYKFSFELKNLSKTTVYNMKEAHNHTFSSKTANWGWAQFAKRDNVYFNSNGVKNQDAFIILCNITSSPAPPPPPPAYRIQTVPKRLLETVGALLDDPLYSDVEFIIPGRRGDIKSARKILASKTLLRRAEYFESMFGSDFVEGSTDQLQTSANVPSASSIMDSEAHFVMNEFEDSDEEDGAEMTAQSDSDSSSSMVSPSAKTTAASTIENPIQENNEVEVDDEQRNVRAKLAHPSSPRSNISQTLSSAVKVSKNSRLSIVVKDVAYNTYMALLYYLYTDIVIFAPLSSMFVPKAGNPTTSNTRSPSPSEDASTSKNNSETPTSRRQWIQQWKEEHPDLPVPCSAKAMYRLADRIDLPELKARASQHIVKSLTVENIAYEIFTPFAAAFEDIRKVQVDFFLGHWKDIRTSDSMRNVWQQIRNGRHPGFEEVWPVIASNLEFKPSPKPTTSKSSEGGEM